MGSHRRLYPVASPLFNRATIRLYGGRPGGGTRHRIGTGLLCEPAQAALYAPGRPDFQPNNGRRFPDRSCQHRLHPVVRTAIESAELVSFRE